MTEPVTDEPHSAYESLCLAEGNGPAVRDILDLVGDKWSLLIVGTLRRGPIRFGQLKRHIPGISQRMLTLTLRHLERDGLLTRTVYGEVPLRVDYALTETGETLIAPSLALASWAIEHYPDILTARRQFDLETS